jgi:hypothetical protein
MSSSMMSTFRTLCRAKSAQSAIVLGDWHNIGRLRTEIDSFMGYRGTYPKVGMSLCQEDSLELSSPIRNVPFLFFVLLFVVGLARSEALRSP